MSFIKSSTIQGFRTKKDGFNYTKLIKLLEELNDNYNRKNAYSCYLLVKAVLNHVPPLLGYPDFAQLASNYSWSSTAHKKYAEHLDKVFIEEAHDATHTVISHREDQLSLDSISQVKTQLNTVLEECKTKTVTTPQVAARSRVKVISPKTRISLTASKLQWANFGSFELGVPSFLAKININNFGNARLNYIESVRLEGVNDQGDKFAESKFKFQDMSTGERMKVDPDEIRDTFVQIRSDVDTDALTAPYAIPKIDRDKLELVFLLADGSEVRLKPTGIEKP